MSTVTVRIELSPEALQLQQELRDAPDDFAQAVKHGLDRATKEVATRIRSKRLTGRGPFPVEEHRLGQVTGMLYGTTDATDAIVIREGDIATVTSSIGTPMPYAQVHEFGFSGEESVRDHYSQSKKGKVFPVRAYTRQVNIPARAPFQTGIDENLDYITEQIDEAIQEEVLK
jgi:phage gpG-like protein